MLEAMKKEIFLRKDELPQAPLHSIYFGGGTPSLLSPLEFDSIINVIRANFQLSNQVEITLEMNPDDVTENYLEDIKAVGINRLSLGVQSFFDAELRIMNRVHTAQESLLLLEKVAELFSNYSMDLIYGMPNSTIENWKKNIDIALSFSPPHISSYALTVEPKTILEKQVERGEVNLLAEEDVEKQFNYLVKTLEKNGYDHYEISNFGKKSFHAVNNSAYWEGKPYLGIGPSAHSYYKDTRSWNIRNNQIYLKSISENRLPIERESLSLIDQYNEYIMTGLRTSSGVSLTRVSNNFGRHFSNLLEKEAEKHLINQHLFWDGDQLKASSKGKFLVDGIASDLFLINL